MSVHKLIANGSFGPAEIKLMTAAYEAALLDLGLADTEDVLSATVWVVLGRHISGHPHA